MRRPGFLDKLRANAEAKRQPGDPVNPGDTAPSNWTEVRLRDLGGGVIRRSREDCDGWCREECKGSWTVRMDRGPERTQMIPIYAFADENEAFWFKMRFAGTACERIKGA